MSSSFDRLIYPKPVSARSQGWTFKAVLLAFVAGITAKALLDSRFQNPEVL